MVAVYHVVGFCDPYGEGRFILYACLISTIFVEKFTPSVGFSSHCLEAYQMFYLSRSEVKVKKPWLSNVKGWHKPTNHFKSRLGVFKVVISNITLAS